MIPDEVAIGKRVKKRIPKNIFETMIEMKNLEM